MASYGVELNYYNGSSYDILYPTGWYKNFIGSLPSRYLETKYIGNSTKTAIINTYYDNPLILMVRGQQEFTAVFCLTFSTSVVHEFGVDGTFNTSNSNKVFPLWLCTEYLDGVITLLGYTATYDYSTNKYTINYSNATGLYFNEKSLVYTCLIIY